ncbi:hypothetical protein LOTGIDRAFT_123531 [Lottia gigantea]|uniref:Copine-3 n=1 Tax=Lottia gigantea TaxID=225164 RepID=V4A0S4_LOTGI|nr:hypothetical protein LOTGIDRAFT_123531 [Lottia gigantea]ESO90287.1 hypothetical protein LOTGIDRAFT_123531 [Lottia gigantea]
MQRPPTECAAKVEIRIECTNLLDQDTTSKSDPCAVLYMARSEDEFYEVGRTENVRNCLDPKFAKSFVTNYYFEEVQKVRIVIYDLDNESTELSDDAFLGKIECTLGQLVSNNPYSKPLVYESGQEYDLGTITVRTEEVKEGGEILDLTFKAAKLENKDFMGKSDPFLEILKSTVDGSWQVVHRTEVVENNLNPSWNQFSVPVQTLGGGDIQVDIYDWDSDGSHDLIGGFMTNVEEIITSQSELSWPCINEKKKAKKKSYSNSGMVYLASWQISKDHSFLEYIFGGMQVNFTVGIDFTASNGNPRQPTSLHYIDPYKPNEYIQAIRSVGGVCQDYDTDKMFPVLGFGAKIPPQFDVSHEFAVNFNLENPFCAGIEGVVQAYMNCISQVQLFGPTNASPTINHVARFAATAQQQEGTKGAHAYYVLLLLTDGVLTDMSNTLHAIVQASKLPMSLIIVGVGTADFTDMNTLDGDNGMLRAPNGEVAKRDIVQFVPLRDFKQAYAELARHVLAEVPKQVTGYYKMRGLVPNVLKPNPPPPAQ